MGTGHGAEAWASAGLAALGITRNGLNRPVGAIDLDANALFSEMSPEVVDEAGNSVAISEAAQALPQMNGSGMVRNLRAAMSLSGTQAGELARRTGAEPPSSK